MLESNTFRVCFGATFLMCALSYGQALSGQKKPQAVAPAPEYRIHTGDVIKLDVWKQPEITSTVSVDREGNINMPLIRDVKAAGLTVTELAALIRHKLEAKIPNPQVTVTITEIRDLSAVPQELRLAPPQIIRDRS
jgi:protein involved in polysaccharide export with SLBB domain